MGRRLRSLLKKHSSIYCILKLLRQFMNYDFRDYLLSYHIGMRWREFILPVSELATEEGMIQLLVHKRGELNPDKIFFMIDLNSKGSGFCAQWFALMNRISFADAMNMEPCVKWSSSNLYKEKVPIRGTTNIFEYYFQPVHGIKVKDAEKSRFVVYDGLYEGRAYGLDWFHVPLVGNLYKYTEKDINQYARMMQKYICLQKSVQRKLNKQLNELFGKDKKVIGVHGRGGDMKLAPVDHPQIIPASLYADAAKDAMTEINAEFVFLATDDEEILNVFKERFGDCLIYYKDVIRTSGLLGNAMMEVERPQHHYKLGYEILRDVYTLAHCQGLITGSSYVNGAARIFNKVYGDEYEFQQILNTGWNQEGVNLNNPKFLENDEQCVRKIREIQSRKDLSECERSKMIEAILSKTYEIEKMETHNEKIKC